MVIFLKPLPEDDDSKADLDNLDISEETEAKPDLFSANYKHWRPMVKSGNDLEQVEFPMSLRMEIGI